MYVVPFALPFQANDGFPQSIILFRLPPPDMTVPHAYEVVGSSSLWMPVAEYSSTGQATWHMDVMYGRPAARATGSDHTRE